jgi:hypothetical protein
MKKITMMLAMVLTLSTTYAFAGEEPINKKALNAFGTEFAGATEVTWAVSNDYYKVTFTLNDQKLFAFYKSDGQFMAVTRNISSFQLPLNLQSSLKKLSTNYWITDLFELSDASGTGYYVTLESADTKITLRSINGSDWGVYQKNKKS